MRFDPQRDVDVQESFPNEYMHQVIQVTAVCITIASYQDLSRYEMIAW